MLKFRLLFIGIFFCWFLHSNAQLSLGIEGGGFLSNFYGKGINNDTNLRTGFMLGMIGDFDFRSDMGFRGGLYVKNATVNHQDKNYHQFYLHVPLHYCYRFHVNSYSRISLHAGPYLTFGIVKKEQEKKNLKYLEFGSTGNVDTGLGIGVSYDVDNFSFNIGYDAGFTDIDSSTKDLKNSTGSLSIAYFF